MNRSKRIAMGAVPKGGLRSDARPGGKDLLCRNHDAASISWAGRATKMRNADCGMRNGKRGKEFRVPHSEFNNARSDRPILRKPVETSQERARPADAFCTEAPCPRATT
jgi:hypothetical protein